MNVDELVKAGNFAQIMRECFMLLEKRHEGISGAAYKQTVNLRAYLQSLYDAQPKSINNLPVSIAALGGIAYSWLSGGHTVEAIMAIPSLQFLDAGRKLERMFEPYMASYTTLPILDTPEDLHSADTEPMQQGGYVKFEGLAHLADPCTSYLPKEIADRYKGKPRDPNSPIVNITMTIERTEEEKAELLARVSDYFRNPKERPSAIPEGGLRTAPDENLHAVLVRMVNAPRVDEKLKMVYGAIAALSPNDPNKEKMQGIVREWEQRHGLKETDK